MDPFLGPDVLPERCDVHITENGGIESIPTLPWMSRSMCGLAGEHRVQPVEGDGVHGQEIRIGRVHHHRSIDLIKCPSLDHVDLASAPFLSRRTEHGDPAAGSVGEGCGGETCSETCGGDDVVAAGVTESGKGVVLEQHCNIRT